MGIQKVRVRFVTFITLDGALQYMKNVTKVQSMIETSLNLSIPVRCPYCSVITTINRLMTEPKCNHFERFTLFKKEPYSFDEMDEDDGDDKARMVETTFRMSGSRYPNVQKCRTGQLVDLDGEFKLMVDGKFIDMLNDDEDDDDVQYTRGD